MQEEFKSRTNFPFLTVSRRCLDEGEDVFSFGYPLSDLQAQDHGGMKTAETLYSPRTTSAIISSLIDRTGMIMSPALPRYYVLDKALNYGNSGGPILASATGHVHAFCSRFQPNYIPQAHLASQGKQPPIVMSPSLYGVVVRLSNPAIFNELEKRGVEISNE